MFRRSIFMFCVLCIVTLAGGGCVATGTSFTWEVDPLLRTIDHSTPAVYTITIKTKNNINAKVSLRVTGLPANTTGTLNPQVIPDTATSSTYTIQPTANTPAGTYTIHFFATEEGQAEQALDRTLIVTNAGGDPDFSLEVTPPEYTFGNVFNKTFSYYLTPINGFSGDVAITITGLTDDLHITSGPNPATVPIGKNGHSGSGGTFVLGLDPVPPVPSPVTLTVTATVGSITHTGTIQIIIPQ